MAGFHAYHPHSQPDGNPATITLSKEESTHLVRSLRAKAGDTVQAFDGTGRTWTGTIANPDPHALTINVRATANLPPPRPAIALIQAIPKAGLMDDIIRAAVEIGAAEIHPLYTEHCEVRLDAQRTQTRLARWQTIAIEACKQSANIFLPRIATPLPLAEWLALPAPDTLTLVASLEPEAIPVAALPPAATPPGLQKLQILIGPEGDFSPAEYAAIRRRNHPAVRLGPHVMRVPTAAGYALATLDQLRQRIRAM